MSGSTAYLKILKDTLKKEISFTDQGKKDQVDFITKIMKDITGVQTGLKGKAKLALDRLSKQKIDTQKGAAATPSLQQKRGSEQKKGFKKTESASPTKQTGKAKPTGDVFEAEVKDMESRITTQIVTMVTF